MSNTQLLSDVISLDPRRDTLTVIVALLDFRKHKDQNVLDRQFIVWPP